MGALVHSILRACFAEEKDIAEEAVVQACLKRGRDSIPA